VISIYGSSFGSAVKMTARSVVSMCPLGFSGSELSVSGLPGSDLTGPGLSFSGRPAVLSGRPVRVRDERETKALEAAVAATQAKAHVFAAASAGTPKQMNQHLTMWAFRGLEPWSDPA
jgi:hypothetical protein